MPTASFPRKPSRAGCGLTVTTPRQKQTGKSHDADKLHQGTSKGALKCELRGKFILQSISHKDIHVRVEELFFEFLLCMDFSGALLLPTSHLRSSSWDGYNTVKPCCCPEACWGPMQPLPWLAQTLWPDSVLSACSRKLASCLSMWHVMGCIQCGAAHGTSPVVMGCCE